VSPCHCKFSLVATERRLALKPNRISSLHSSVHIHIARPYLQEALVLYKYVRRPNIDQVVVVLHVAHVMRLQALVLLVIQQRVLDVRLDTAVQVAPLALWVVLAAQFVPRARTPRLEMTTHARHAIPVAHSASFKQIGLFVVLGVVYESCSGAC